MNTMVVLKELCEFNQLMCLVRDLKRSQKNLKSAISLSKKVQDIQNNCHYAQVRTSKLVHPESRPQDAKRNHQKP